MSNEFLQRVLTHPAIISKMSRSTSIRLECHRLTRSQIIVLNNAMNEVLHGPEAIEDWEFHTRIGVTRREAEAVLKGIAGALGHGGGIA